MRRYCLASLTILILAAAAQAQFLPRPGHGPGAGVPGSPLSGGIGAAPGGGGYSPYLNLIRGGGTSAAVNYYGIVRPQQNIQTALQAVQQQQQAGGASFEPDDPTLPGLVVGTRVRFLNTSGYFLNLQGGTTSQVIGSGFASALGGRGGAVGAQGAMGQGAAGFGTGFGTGFGPGLGTGLGTGGAFGGSPGSGNRPPIRGR